MDTIAETDRLILRKLDVSDALNFYNLNADPEVLKYTGDLPFETLAQAEGFLVNYNDYQKNGFGRWAVISKTSNAFLGWCGLKLNDNGLVDLGFRFFRKEWGKGFATESANASLHFGFNKLELNEIIGRASTDNKASIKVLEKLGMQFWKRDFCEGIADASYYLITKSQYTNGC